jgi:hypothetical protein
MEDILNMSPWDFNGLVEVAGRKKQRTPHRPLKESQKDMIRRSKEMD